MKNRTAYKKMVLYVLALCLPLLLLCGCKNGEQAQDPTPQPTQQDPILTPTPLPTISADETWMLILANADNPLPEGFTPQVEKVQGNYQMDYRCASAMKNMIEAAKSDGVTLTLTSAYRSKQYQQGLFDNKIKRLMDEGKTREQAERIAPTVVALPGTSEHQTGLAADIITPSYTRLDEGFANTEAFAWLQQHAHEYGFVMRYAKHKQDITGIIYEPWHYRYVGVEHAKRMLDNDWCLEEYLEQYYGL